MLAALLQACTLSTPQSQHQAIADSGIDADQLVVELKQAHSLAQVLESSPQTRVWMVGETHTRFDHHQVQLEILKLLEQGSEKLALAVEWFQQPFQAYLDDYISGRISEAEMLEKTGYFERWRYDYRLYRPILAYARQHGIPVIALNASRELTTALRKTPAEDLSADLKRQLPDSYDLTDIDYATRLRRVYDSHPEASMSFEAFLRGQLTWDESMAQRSAQYLRENPQARLLILAGSGHIRDGSGIPNRILRRINIDLKTVLISDSQMPVSSESADYLVLSSAETLPAAGLLGAYLKSKEGQVVIQGYSENSALRESPVQEGDVIIGIDEIPVHSYTELKLALLGRKPGDSLQLHYLVGGAGARQTQEIVLGR